MLLLELKKRMKVIKTCNLYLSFFVLGFSISLTGPCLLDLQHMVHTDTQTIALVYTARSIGYVLGAICGGIVLDLVRHKQAVFAGCNFFIVITMFAMPWSRDVLVLLGFMVVNGFTLGSTETGANVMCLQLWGKDSNAVFQGMHLLYGLGGLIAPLTAAPFLEYREEQDSIQNTTSSGEPYLGFVANTSSNSTDISYELDSHIPQIIYPFYILGALATLMTFLFAAVGAISPTEEGHQAEVGDNSDRSNTFLFSTVLFFFLLFFVAGGTEIGYGQSLFTYAVKGNAHASTTVGSYVTSAYWAAFTIARLISVYIATKVSCMAMMIGDMCIVSVSALMLLFFMPNEWALWLASVVFGTGLSNMYATLVAWVNTHIYITNKISAIGTVGCAAGEMVMPFLMVYFTDTIPEMFAYVVTASSILLIILIFILHSIFKNGRRITPPNETKLRVSVVEIVSEDKSKCSA